MKLVLLGTTLMMMLFTAANAALVRPSVLQFGVAMAYDGDLAVATANKVAGIEAALKEANDANEVDGVRLAMKYVNAPAEVGSPATVGIVQSLVETDGVFGIFGTDYFASISAWMYTESRGVPLIAPTATLPQMFSSSSPNTLMYRATFDQETTQLLNYMVNSQWHCFDIMILYFNDTNVKALAEEGKKSLIALGYPAPTLFALDPNETPTGYNIDALLEIIQASNESKRCLLTLDSNNGLVEMMTKLMQNAWFRSEVDDIGIFAPSVANVPNDWKLINGSAEAFQNVYIAQVFPDPRDPGRSPAVARYQQGMQAFFAQSNWSSYIPAALLPRVTNAYDYSALEGYLSVRFLVEILKKTPSITRANVVATAYEAKLFTMDDVMLGPFTRACVDPLRKLNCFCNSGSRLVFITRVNKTTGQLNTIYDDQSRGEDKVAYGDATLSKCSLQPSDVQSPINVAVEAPVITNPGQKRVLDGAHFIYRFFNTQVNFNKMINGGAQLRSEIASFSNVAGQISAEATRFLTKLVFKNYGVIMFIGNFAPIPDRDVPLVLESNEWTMRVTDPPRTAYEEWPRNFIYLDAALADHVHTLMQFALARHPDGIHVLGGTEQYVSLAKMSSHHFQKEWLSEGVFDEDNITLTGLLGVSSPMMIVTQTKAAIEAVVYAAMERPDAVFYLATAEAILGDVMAYSMHPSNVSFGQAINASASKPNILFASMHTAFWGDAGGLREFITALNFTVPYPTPIGLAVGQLRMSAVFDIANKMSTSGFNDNAKYSSMAADVLYQAQTLSVDSISLGPFVDNNCANATGGSSCQCNKGPRRFYVHNLLDWIEEVSTPSRTNSYSVNNADCSIVYEPIAVPTDWTAVIAAIGASFGAACLGVCGAIYLVFTRKQRNNKAAPKDESKPFTIVFTDIQSSTSLWARAPEAMSFSVEQHHNEIRKLVSKYDGYEVKTIGDSFMVAFKKTSSALQFSLAIQSVFYELEWPSDIDATYIALHQEKMEAEMEAADPQTPAIKVTQPIDLDDYAKNWNGVRVRVGCHHGFGNIKLDPVSMGYDYYGTVVNTGARVEGVGHGGQVLLTEEAVSALHDERANIGHLYESTDLGPQPLRGLDLPVRLIQFLPKETPGRKFPDLRLDVERDVDNDEEESISQASGMNSLPSGSSGSKQTIESMTGMIEKFMEKQAKKWKGDLMFPPAFKELMEHYHFLRLMVSTQKATKRKELLDALATKWQVKPNANLPPATQEPFLMANLTLKIKRALDVSGTPKRLSSQMPGGTASSAGPMSPMVITSISGTPGMPLGTVPRRQSLEKPAFDKDGPVTPIVLKDPPMKRRTSKTIAPPGDKYETEHSTDSADHPEEAVPANGNGCEHGPAENVTVE